MIDLKRCVLNSPPFLCILTKPIPESKLLGSAHSYPSPSSVPSNPPREENFAAPKHARDRKQGLPLTPPTPPTNSLSPNSPPPPGYSAHRPETAGNRSQRNGLRRLRRWDSLRFYCRPPAHGIPGASQRFQWNQGGVGGGMPEIIHLFTAEIDCIKILLFKKKDANL